MVRSGAQRRVSNHGPGYQSGDAFLWLKTQSARSASRRAQFQLWIFSYTFGARSSKNRVSRLRFIFISFSRADKQNILGCFTGNTRRAAPWARFMKYSVNAPPALFSSRSEGAGATACHSSVIFLL